MKLLKKISIGLYALLLCFGIMSMPVLAASMSQDGLEITLTTDKDTYSQGEQIVATLELKNNNETAVNNISLKKCVPTGYKFANSTEETTEIATLAPGETVTVNVTFVSENAGNSGNTNPTVTNPPANTPVPTPDATAVPAVSNQITSPKTGDSTGVIAIIAFSVCGFILAILAKKKKKYRKSLVCCLALTLVLVSGYAIRTNAAEELQRKTLTVTHEVTVNGVPVSLSASIEYDAPVVTMTRGEWIEKLITACGHPYIVDGELITYGDIADSEYSSYIETAVVYGILHPETGENFNPDDLATREFVAETAAYSMGYVPSDDIVCDDVADIKNPGIINEAVRSGLLSLEDNHFYPNRPLTTTEGNAILTTVENEFNASNSTEDTVPTGFVFLENVVVKETGFDWETNGNEATLPAGETVPAVGQIIVFGTEKAIKIESVNTTEEKTTVTYSTPELYEFLDSMNLQGEATMDFANFIPAEGVTITGNSALDSGIQTFGFMDHTFDVPATDIDLNQSVTLNANVNLTRNVNLAVDLKVAIPAVEYKFDIDFDANIFNDEPAVNVKNAYLKIHNDLQLHTELVAHGDSVIVDDLLYPPYIELGTIPLIGADGVGVVLEVDLVATAEGKFELDYRVFGTLGVQVLNNRPKNISGLQSTSSVGISGAVKVGPQLKALAEVFEKDIISFSANAGVKAGGSAYYRNTGMVCLDAGVRLFAELNAFEDCLIDDWLDVAMKFVIWDDANSPLQLAGHWENLVFVDECTYNSEGTIRGTVADADNRTSYINNAEIKLMHPTEHTIKKTAHSDTNGAYNVTIAEGDYLVRISADGYIPFESVETVESGEVKFLETYLMVEGSENTTDTGVIGGKITNAVTGTGISNANLTIRKGWNKTSGDVVKTLQSDSYGGYSVELPLGNYTIVLEREGYISSHINVAVTARGNNGYHAVMNPDGNSTIELGDMRIILTWTDEPRDLDSHLWGPTVNGEDLFHIYYSNMSYYDNESRRAFLDIDDTSYDGPETTTVYDMSPNGTYSFYVHDYTNRYYESSSVLANSGARVQVFMGEELIANYHVPTSGIGTVWHVFDFDAVTGQIIGVNEFSYVYSPSAVGNPMAAYSLRQPADEEKVVAEETEIIPEETTAITEEVTEVDSSAEPADVTEEVTETDSSAEPADATEEVTETDSSAEPADVTEEVTETDSSVEPAEIAEDVTDMDVAA